VVAKFVCEQLTALVFGTYGRAELETVMDHLFAFLSVAYIASLPSLVSVHRLHGGEAVLANIANTP
jgi:hypothetical protein